MIFKNVAKLSRQFCTQGKKTFDHKRGAPVELPYPTAEKFMQKTTRISVLGAASQTGQALSLLLKQNPLVSHVYLYDKYSTVGIAADLKHLDTRCEVTGFVDRDINEAIRNADVIVLLGIDKFPKDIPLHERVRSEGHRLISLATACATFAPKAVLIDCVYPVSVSLPLVSEIYRRNHWYHPGRVIGSTALLQIRLNSLLARHQNLDPSSVHVPLLGGPDYDTILPLFSRATPSGLPITDSQVLINRFRNLPDDAPPTAQAQNKPDYCPNSNAFAINRLVTTVALGILGDSDAIATAHVRSNFVKTCRHVVSTVKFGNTGVIHNYGVPRLTKFELKLFERVCLELEKREEFAHDFLETCTNTPKSVDTDLIDRVFVPDRPKERMAVSD